MNRVTRTLALSAALVAALWAVGAVHAASTADPRYTFKDRAAFQTFIARDFVTTERKKRLIFNVHDIGCVKVTLRRFACVLSVTAPIGPSFYTAIVTCKTTTGERCRVMYDLLA